MAGQAALFVITVAASHGTYSESGQSAAFAFGGLVDYGSYALTGQSATLAEVIAVEPRFPGNAMFMLYRDKRLFVERKDKNAPVEYVDKRISIGTEDD
jgi:hypothetical protein